VLVASHNYPRFAGDPAGTYVRRLALGLAARGHQVRVVAPHAPGTAVAETEAGVCVERFRYAPERLERIGYRGEARARRLLLTPGALVLPAYLLAFRHALRAAGARFRPDVLHAHWWLPAGWLAASAGPPLIVTSHGSDVRLLEQSAWLRGVARGVARRAARWTAASRFLARDIERQLGLASGAVAVTPMPVDVTLFEQGAGTARAVPPRVLYAGNLVPSKGVDVLLAAIAILRDQGVSCTLRILGEGPARADLEARITSLRLTDRVTLDRFVPQPAMPAEYGAATVTVLPTRGRAEGLGLTLVEALLAGSAVVGTPAGGIPEVIEHDVTGLLVPDGDAAGLARALARLLGDAALRARLVEAGRGRVRRSYALEPAVDRFLELFHAAQRDRPVR